ncbi:hypothetical protein WAH72_09190 [Acinetobacter baumannii]|nr:hypothetical protein [Acinetobacter baumannii]
MGDIDFNALKKREQKTGAAPQQLGGDFQFWYFLYCLLDLRRGEKIGFEIKEDVHLELSNGKCILSQLKHTVQESMDGEKINLTDLDEDLWKTLSNWVLLIKASGNELQYIEKNEFILATNKNIVESSFPYLFTCNSDVNEIIAYTKRLKEKSSKKGKIIKYIDLFLSLDDKCLIDFIGKIKIEYGISNIVEKVKIRVKEKANGSKHYLDIFYNLHTLVTEQKYLDISNKKEFFITYDDFNKKYRNCFLVGEHSGKLPNPDRMMEFNYPEELEKQNFIKQLVCVDLIDINDVVKIKEYTAIMLSFINKLEYWIETNLILPSDTENLDDVNKYMWKSRFEKIYRPIIRKIKAGVDINSLEDEIKVLAWDIYDEILEEKIKISSYDELDIKLSNGYFYNLSDKLEIGWHYSWEDRFK